MAARDTYLAIADYYRAQLDQVWGHRQHEVYIRVSTVTPGAPSYGSYGGPGFSASETITETRITVGPLNDSNPKVEQVKQQDVVASGGLYQTQDLRVGPLTPSYPGGGLDPDIIDPPQSATTKSVAYRIVGPSTPAEGAIYAKVGQTITKNYGYYLILRKTAEEPV
jgi:hypothetical protein